MELDPRDSQDFGRPAQPRRMASPQPLRSADACGLATRFQAWRGRSGRRYVVSVHRRGRLPDFADAVLLAVRCDPLGAMTLLGVRTTDDGLAGWDALAQADEIHVHLLALRPAERRKVVEDLGDE